MTRREGVQSRLESLSRIAKILTLMNDGSHTDEGFFSRFYKIVDFFSLVVLFTIFSNELLFYSYKKRGKGEKIKNGLFKPRHKHKLF